MKIIHTSDWHLGKSLYDFSLLDDQRHMLDFLLELIESEQIDAVIIAGDIYDRPVASAEAVRLYDYFLTRAVREAGTKVVAIAGNHDSASRLEFGSSLYAGSGYYVFGTVKDAQEPAVLRAGGDEVHIHPVPWLYPAEIRALYESGEVRTFDGAYRALLAERIKLLDPDACNIAVAHGFFAGLSAHPEKDILISDSEVNLGGMDIADSDCFAPFDYTALGHLHAPQLAGSIAVRYSGSPLKYSLSEENQKKSFTIIDIPHKNELSVRTVPVPQTRDVRTITGCFDELLEPSFHTNKNFDDYVFANITDSGVLYPMEKLRTLFPNLLGLRFIANDENFSAREASLTGEARPSTLELFRRFYKSAKSDDMPEDRLDFLREIIEKSEVGSE